MAVSTNQRQDAVNAATSMPGGPNGMDSIRNVLLAYISENLNPLSSLGTGMVKVTSGVASVATSNTDYLPATSPVVSAGVASAGGASTGTRGIKLVTGLTNAVAGTVLTFTVPNAAHAAFFEVKLLAMCGAGGAVGANESQTGQVIRVVVSRTAGLATVVTASSTYGSATASVAGAATLSMTASLTSMTGANSASQTFSLQVSVSRSAGSATNHTCLVDFDLLNANASGVTVA